LGVKARANPEGKSKSHTPIVELDPNKLQILEGTFCCQDRALPQLRPNQVGPLSSGVILMSHQEVEPYLLGQVSKSHKSP
jgi:hypothetical protein